MTHFERIVEELDGKRQIDFARIFRAAARMKDSDKARNLITAVTAAASKPKDLSSLTDETYAAHYKKRKTDIDHLHRELKSEFRAAQSEVQRKLRRHFAHADIQSAEGDDFMFDPAQLSDDLAEVLRSTIPQILIDAGTDVYSDFLPPPEDAKAFITKRENLMSNVSQETFDSVKAELQAGLDKGESYKELSRRLSDKFDEIAEGRAETTAMTEVASAYGYARDEAMKQSGATHKLWLGSGRPPGTLHGMRPAHAAAHYEQQTRAIDEPFVVGGERLMFPTDSSLGAGPEMTINCHCIAQPMEAPISSGDLPGHEFHGNQYSGPFYHGSPKSFQTFDAAKRESAKGSSGGAIWLTSRPEEAQAIAEFAPTEGTRTPTVKAFTHQLRNPLVVDIKGERLTPTDREKAISKAKASGHDGIIFHNIDIMAGGKQSHYLAVFNPKHLKAI